MWGAPEESVLLLAPCMQCAVSGGRAGRLHADWWKGQTSVSAVRAACAVSSLSPFFYFIWGRRWEGSRAMLKNTEGELLGFWENNWCCFHSLDLESPLKQLWLFFPFLLKSVMVASFCICFFFLQLERELCLHPDPGSEGDSGKLQQLWVRNECGGAALAGFI